MNGKYSDLVYYYIVYKNRESYFLKVTLLPLSLLFK